MGGHVITHMLEGGRYYMPNNDWNPSLYDQKHAYVSEYGKALISVLAPRAGELILDVGCGTGHLAKAIAEAGARVIGIDSSTSMIETARKTYPGIEFLVADARDFSFPAPFDAVFSNATLHWITEQEQVVNCIAVSLKTGGRFVAEFAGKGNVGAIVTAIQQSVEEILHVLVDAEWYYPSIGEYATLLENHGLAVRSALLFDRPTQLEDGEMGLRNWVTMFAEHMFRTVPGDVRQQVLDRVEEKLRPVIFKEGHWFADYRRLRIVAYKDKSLQISPPYSS
jgi:trans-aconitate methyltransferase